VSLVNDDRCKELLIKGLQSKIAKIRRLSYSGLEKFQDKNALMTGLRDVDPVVRIAAATSLGRLGMDDMANIIRKEMTTVNLDIWKECIVALGRLQDSTAIPFIRDSLLHETEVPMELRVAACEALFMFDNREGMTLLKEAFETGNPFIRVKIVQILRKYKTREGIELLREAAIDEYINVSVVAVEALGEFKLKDHRDLFVKLMDAPNPLLRIAAATAFLRGE
jgi:HEAT repeat protein